MTDIENWMKKYMKAVISAFGARVIFVGLQGSRGRGEARPDSDIDVVLILDSVSLTDLGRYKETVSCLPEREKICGFVSGRAELAAWARYDLFQFYYDTTAYYGRLDDIIAVPCEKDARRALLFGACNLYHFTSHNFLHEYDTAVLRSIYKTAAFALRALYYCRNKVYIRKFSDLQRALSGEEKTLCDYMLKIKNGGEITDEEFSSLSSFMLGWTANLIEEYREDRTF